MRTDKHDSRVENKQRHPWQPQGRVWRRRFQDRGDRGKIWRGAVAHQEDVGQGIDLGEQQRRRELLKKTETRRHNP
jgi:hypothetical protein